MELVKEQAEAKRGDEPADEYVAKFVLVKDPNKYVPCTPWLPPWLLPCTPPSPPGVQCTHVSCVYARGRLPLLPSVCRWGIIPCPLPLRTLFLRLREAQKAIHCLFHTYVELF